MAGPHPPQHLDLRQPAQLLGRGGLVEPVEQGEQLVRYGVTVNAIAPGLIETDMTRATAERIGVPYETYVAKAAEQIPVARTGTPEDIAAAASFFARQEASFISGQVLYVAGGPKA